MYKISSKDLEYTNSETVSKLNKSFYDKIIKVTNSTFWLIYVDVIIFSKNIVDLHYIKETT